MSSLNNSSTAPKKGIFLNAIRGASHHKLPIHHNSPSNASRICQNIVLVLQWQLMLLLSAPFRVSPSVPKMDRIAIIENFEKMEIQARPIPVGKTYFFSKKNTSLKVSLKKCVCLWSFVSVAERNYFYAIGHVWSCVCVCDPFFIFSFFTHGNRPFSWAAGRAFICYLCYNSQFPFPFVTSEGKIRPFFLFFSIAWETRCRFWYSSSRVVGKIIRGARPMQNMPPKKKTETLTLTNPAKQNIRI